MQQVCESIQTYDASGALLLYNNTCVESTSCSYDMYFGMWVDGNNWAQCYGVNANHPCIASSELLVKIANQWST